MLSWWPKHLSKHIFFLSKMKESSPALIYHLPPYFPAQPPRMALKQRELGVEVLSHFHFHSNHWIKYEEDSGCSRKKNSPIPSFVLDLKVGQKSTCSRITILTLNCDVKSSLPTTYGLLSIMYSLFPLWTKWTTPKLSVHLPQSPKRVMILKASSVQNLVPRHNM